MGYKAFMEGLVGRVRGSVERYEPGELFAVLDDLKASVEGHGFGNNVELSRVLREYPLTRVGYLSGGVEQDISDRRCRCKQEHPLATSIMVTGNVESKERVERLVLGADSMLVKDGPDSYGFYPREGMEDGNRYKFRLGHYANAVAWVSVLHRIAPPRLNELRELLKGEIGKRLRGLKEKLARAREVGVGQEAVWEEIEQELQKLEERF